MADVVTRFAPSPTGHLHLGHAHSALFAWHRAQEAGGRFLLRIEDIDLGRCRPEFEAAILEDLAWLGLTWEEPVRRQSERLADYEAVLDRLTDEGLLYPCFCTRKEIEAEVAASAAAPHGPEGPLYPGICRGRSRLEQARRIAEGAAYALRLDVAAAAGLVGPLTWEEKSQATVTAEPTSHGDVVLGRKDVRSSYHLAVTLDDADQGVTLVTRGEDLRPATDVHRLLQALLDLPVPVWQHHGLVFDDSGRRLAKRHDALSVRALRDGGKSPAEVRAMAGFPD
ncbi:MAG: tRNA glutamyl-Q(34) synthetase GluQRS [Kiloniellales bacterium]|nr:tRNA glutamyl-Q(34) synthetase GluQRS [Kiloniellales bacterium]